MPTLDPLSFTREGLDTDGYNKNKSDESTAGHFDTKEVDVRLQLSLWLCGTLILPGTADPFCFLCNIFSFH